MTQVPTLKEYEELWKVWDMVTLEMIPEDLLQEKPILLRHPCIFYLGIFGFDLTDFRTYSDLFGHPPHAGNDQETHGSGVLYANFRTGD